MTEAPPAAVSRGVEPPTGLADLLNGIRPELDRVEETLRGWASSGHPLVSELGKPLLAQSGKRLRPAVVLLSARLLGGGGGEDVFLGALMELLHTASLIHDDIVDNARTRRGLRTLHATWGTSLTVLLGDYLFIRSVDLALSSRHERAVRILAEASARMIEGELLETVESGNLDLGEADYLRIVERKTAALFAGCGRLGAVLAGAGEREEEELRRFGLDFGMAFQVVDDVLDFTAVESSLGKPILSDLAEGRVTLPVIRLLAADPDGARRRRVAALLFKKRPAARTRRELVEALGAAGALEGARRVAAEHAARARERLAAFPDSPARRALDGLAAFVLTRDR